MQTFNYISYRGILEQVKDDFKFVIGNINELEAKQWLARLMGVTSSYHSLISKSVFLEVINGFVETPEDMSLIISIGRSCEPTLKDAECNPCNVAPMRWDTSDANCRTHYTPLDYYVSTGDRYVINDSAIFTGDGVIKVTYKALPTDENGDPMVPEDGSWQEAAIHELAWKVARNLYFNDNFDERKLQRIERDRDWYVAQAINRSKMMNRPQREVFKDNYIKTIKDLYPEDSQMATLADREYRKWHGNYLT